MKCPKCETIMKAVAVAGLTLSRRMYRCPNCGHRQSDEVTRERISKTK